MKESFFLDFLRTSRVSFLRSYAIESRKGEGQERENDLIEDVGTRSLVH